MSPNKRLCALSGMFAALAFSIGIPVLLDARKQLLADSSSAVRTADAHDSIDTEAPIVTEGSDAVKLPIDSASKSILDPGALVASERMIRSAARPR